MIDTIVIRINNLSKYPTIYEQYYKSGNKAVTTAMVDTTTGEILENKESIHAPAMVFHDTSRIIPITHRSSNNIPSSHYSLSYFINNSRDFLEFNFSIPKYLYSTNVLQFINRYDSSVSGTYYLLIKFITGFLKQNMVHMPLMDDVEINRLDLCYNQHFNNKSDALLYLDEQKKLLIKYARGSKNAVQSPIYGSSLMYVTANYSFKIYHKGTEFDKHDLVKLMNRNPKKLDIPYLQIESHKILRYEMTFHSRMMNHLVNNYFLTGARAALNPTYRLHPISKIYSRIATYGGGEVVENFIHKQKKMFMRSLFDYTTDLTIYTDNSAFSFDLTIFSIMHQEFKNLIDKYQLITIVSPDRIKDVVATYNKKIADINKVVPTGSKRREKRPANLLLYAMLCQYQPAPEVDKLISRTTCYMLKKGMAEIGLQAGNTLLTVPPPRTDYIDYFINFGRIHMDNIY